MSAASAAKPEMTVTVDLEEYFQVGVMADVVRFPDWDRLPARVEYATRRVLEVFAAAAATGTFFVVGWVAERYPQLIAEVAAAGHEIGCHSYWHRPVFQLSAAEFREDTRRAKAVIEQAAGTAVRGYRAPNFSIHLEMDWAWEVLAEAGFAYDSSVHPVRHPLYGAPRAPRRPFALQRHGLWEFPLTTARLFGQNWPVAGGGYWRLAPRAYTRWGLGRALAEGQRPVCYLHPWELDPDQPRLNVPATRRWRHYTGLRGMARTLEQVLRRHGSAPIAALFAPELAPLAVAV